MKKGRLTKFISILVICAFLISSVCLGNVANVDAAIGARKMLLISTLYQSLHTAGDATRHDILKAITGRTDISSGPYAMKAIADDTAAYALADAINNLITTDIDRDTLKTLIRDFYSYQQSRSSEASFVLQQFKDGLTTTDAKLANIDLNSDGEIDGGFPTIINGIEANTHEYILFINFLYEVKSYYNMFSNSFNPLYVDGAGKVAVYQDLRDKVALISTVASGIGIDLNRINDYMARLDTLINKLNGNEYNHEGQRPAFIANLQAHGLIDATQQNHSGTPTPPPTGGTPTVTAPQDIIPNLNPSGDAVVTAKPTLNPTTGEADTTITEKTMDDALKLAKEDGVGVKGVTLDIAKTEGATSYGAVIPTKYLVAVNKNAEITMTTDLGTITVPNNMFTAAEVGTAKNVELQIGKADNSKLTESQKQQVGNKPVIDVSAKLDGKPYTWKSDEATVKISFKYTPTAEELKDPEHIVIWYLADNGDLISIPSGKYNPLTGEVEFNINHFSKYAVVYVVKSFTDLDKYSWAKKPISVMASKGIVSGVGGDKFDPASNITRGDYIHMLVNTLGLNAKVDSNFDDVSADSYYYRTIGIAKKLGITSGVGKNKLDPKAYITRQDMMALTARALKIAKKIDGTVDKTSLNKFKDKNKLAAYAVDSAAMMVKAGIISGSGENIMPMANTSRAEAAAIMYRIYNK